MAKFENIILNGTTYDLASGGVDFAEEIITNYHGVAMQTNGVNFGLAGILLKVNAGDSVKINFSPRSLSVGVPFTGVAGVLQLAYSDKAVWLYDEYLSEIRGHVLHTFTDIPSDSIYEVPSNLEGDLCMLFYTEYGAWEAVALARYQTTAIKKSFVIEGTTDVSPWYHDYQSKSFLASEESNKVLFWSLYQAVSGLVNANMLVLGDSITETVAKETVANNIQGNRPYYGNGFITNIVRKYNMTCDITGVSSSRWFPTTGKNSCVDMVKAVCFPEGDAPSADKYDYVIIEFGTNDILFRPSGYGTLADVASDELNCSTVSAIRYCIESLQTTFPFAKILIVMPFIRDPSDQANQKAYIELADQVFDEYGIKRVYPRTQAGITSALMCSDGIHLHVKSDADDPTMLAEGVKRLSECIEGGLLTM